MVQIYFTYLHALHLCDKMNGSYLSTAFMLTLQTVYVQKNGKGPFLVLAIRNAKILIIE